MDVANDIVGMIGLAILSDLLIVGFTSQNYLSVCWLLRFAQTCKRFHQLITNHHQVKKLIARCRASVSVKADFAGEWYYAGVNDEVLVSYNRQNAQFYDSVVHPLTNFYKFIRYSYRQTPGIHSVTIIARNISVKFCRNCCIIQTLGSYDNDHIIQEQSPIRLLIGQIAQHYRELMFGISVTDKYQIYTNGSVEAICMALDMFIRSRSL